MKGRIWLIVGVVVGVAIGIGKLPYFDGAATSLCDTALASRRHRGLDAHPRRCQPRRATPSHRRARGGTCDSRPGCDGTSTHRRRGATLRLREVIAVLLAALGIASFFYLPGGTAVGVALFALLAAGLVVAVTGPIVVAPLAALASLIATVFLAEAGTNRQLAPDDTDLGSSPGTFLDRLVRHFGYG